VGDETLARDVRGGLLFSSRSERQHKAPSVSWGYVASGLAREGERQIVRSSGARIREIRFPRHHL